MSNRYPTAKEFLLPPYDANKERRFFGAMSLPNGTSKTTCEHRLDDVNHASWLHISELPWRPLKILDVAASSGISTVEWHDYLSSQRVDFTLAATDNTARASLVTAGPIAAIVDADQNLVHVDIAGIGMLTRVRSWRRHVVAARTALASFLLRIMKPHIATQPIELVSRRFASNGKILMLQDDLSFPNQPEYVHAFHVIRAANILNLSYFDEFQITLMLSHLKERIVNGGLLIVCRSNEDQVNHGTIFRSGRNSLMPLGRIGSGSEIERLATSEPNRRTSEAARASRATAP